MEPVLYDLHFQFTICFPAGTVILYQDSNWYNPDESIARRKRQAGWQDFQDDLVPNPVYFSSIRDCDLFGYAVTSGRFLSEEILYAGGAPRGADSYGKASYNP